MHVEFNLRRFVNTASSLNRVMMMMLHFNYDATLILCLNILLRGSPQGASKRNERKIVLLTRMEERIAHFPKQEGFQKFPNRSKSNQEWFNYSFQLAKFLSQLIASRRRKTPLHWDGEERRKNKLKWRRARENFIPVEQSGQVGLCCCCLAAQPGLCNFIYSGSRRPNTAPFVQS